MFLFILGLILLAIAVAAFVVSRRKTYKTVKIEGTYSNRYQDEYVKQELKGLRTGLRIASAVLVVFGLWAVSGSVFYTQDVGEAKVVRNIDGSIAGEDLTSGFGAKAPWQDVVDFDIRGQQANYKLDGKATQPGEKVDGPEITVVDSQKIASNVDIAVRYSIKADMVSEIYTVYKTQDVFFDRLIAKDVQSTVREAANNFTTDELLTNKVKYAKTIEDQLRAKWEKQGVSVDSVALGNIRPPQSVTDRINASQQAAQQVITEQANTKVIEEQAKQKQIAAEGEAKSNEILAKSLTPEVLKQRELDVLGKFGEKGNGIVIQGGSGTPLIQVPTK